MQYIKDNRILSRNGDIDIEIQFKNIEDFDAGDNLVPRVASTKAKKARRILNGTWR